MDAAGTLVFDVGVPGTAPAEESRVIVHVRCEHCRRAVELVCAGLQGFWGYQTHNEYICPHCRKRNHERTPGAILAARVPSDGDAMPAGAA
jgi:hypothetical protein